MTWRRSSDVTWLRVDTARLGTVDKALIGKNAERFGGLRTYPQRDGRPRVLPGGGPPLADPERHTTGFDHNPTEGTTEMALGIFAGIAVSNFGAALEWYQQLLGAEPTLYPNDIEAVWQLA